MDIFFISSAHAMAVENGNGGGGIISTILMLAIIFGIFYFLIIRPQKKQQARHGTMLSQLQVGDRVVTAGGIHGKVTAVQEDQVKIEVAKGFKLTMNKSSISTVKGSEDD